MYYRQYNNRGSYIALIIILILLFGGFRLLFGIFGLALALVIQLLPFLVFAYMGYILLKVITKNNTIQGSFRSVTMDHRRFVELLVHIMMAVVKADGRIEQRELDIIRSFFRTNLGFKPSEMVWVTDLIDHSVKETFPLEELCQEFNQKFGLESKLILLQLVYRIVFSDGVLHDSERQLIDRIVQLLGISAADHIRIRSLFDQVARDTGSMDQHYAILGVQKGATRDQIKKAYKEQLKRNHPDKVHHLGPEFRKVAEEKMQKINKSYEVLIKQAR